MPFAMAKNTPTILTLWTSKSVCFISYDIALKALCQLPKRGIFTENCCMQKSLCSTKEEDINTDAPLGKFPLQAI